MPKIKEIMEGEPYTCRMDSTVGDVIRQLTDVRVSGIPIVDDQMHPLGFVSDIDLLRFVTHNRPVVYDWGEHLPVVLDEESPEDKLRSILGAPVSRIAASKIACVEADWEIDEVADYFKREKVRKIAVLENNKVIGVVTRSAVLRHILHEILPDESQ